MTPRWSPRAPVTATRSALRRWFYELRLHAQRWSDPNRRPCVVIFPSSQPWSASSNLRVWLVAPELRRLGWRTVVVPEPLSLAQRRRVLRLERPDVILMQQTRHPLNQPALYAPYPCVLDADDADYLDPRHHARIVECAGAAAAVIGGSRFVAQCLGTHNAHAHVLWTATPRPQTVPRLAPDQREPIVAWAHATPLGYPHEAELVQRVMIEVGRRTAYTFWLFGTTEEAAAEWFAPIRATGARCVATPPMDYPRYLEKVAEAAVGIQPVVAASDFSQGKSFGKLLAYLSGQVAVVASDAVDHPLFFEHGRNGYLVDDSVDAWATAIVDLLTDRARRARLALAAWDRFNQELTTEVFARRLDGVLRSVMEQQASPAAQTPALSGRHTGG